MVFHTVNKGMYSHRETKGHIFSRSWSQEKLLRNNETMLPMVSSAQDTRVWVLHFNLFIWRVIYHWFKKKSDLTRLYSPGFQTPIQLMWMWCVSYLAFKVEQQARIAWRFMRRVTSRGQNFKLICPKWYGVLFVKIYLHYLSLWVFCSEQSTDFNHQEILVWSLYFLSM